MKKGKVVKAIVTRVVAWYRMSVTYGGGGGETCCARYSLKILMQAINGDLSIENVAHR